MKISILAIVTMSLSFASEAIVTRHDVAPDKYIAAKLPEYMIDMPGEGHGVLIQPNWIVTVAHLIFSDYTGKEIKIHGKSFTIEKVIVHPNARKPPKTLFNGDAKPLITFMKSTSDIALIKLSEKVTHVKPISPYERDDEQGRLITAYGRGSTGNGKEGSVFETKRAKVLRKMTNHIDAVEGNWISISFDEQSEKSPLEGIDGSGDSGGPLVISTDGKPYLVGLFSWDYVDGNLSDFKQGLYGGRSYQVRVSRYLDWINRQINAN